MKKKKTEKDKKFVQTAPRNADDYESLCLNNNYEPIVDLKSFKHSWDYHRMVLRYKGVYVGSGDICLKNKKKKYLHTSGTCILEKYRNQGHGIFLYISLIETARKIGAKRIYADATLNKFSTRMWSEKLPKIYKVKVRASKTEKCHTCGGPHRKKSYYIDL